MPLDKPIIAVDCETDPFEYGEVPRPFIWGVYHGYGSGDYKEFVGSGDNFVCTESDINLLVDYLSKQDVIAYAHNGGKFDWHFISHRFEPDSDLLIINGRIARFTIGDCEFRDSYSLMPIALEQYQKMKFNYNKMREEHRHKYMPEIKEYLESDCINLWNMVHDFNDEYGTHITQASAALNFWQRKMKNPVPRSNVFHYDFFKPYYFGGRVQCFQQGDFKVKAKSVDINSAYPDAMLRDHAYGLDYTSGEGNPRKAFKNWGPMFFKIDCISKGAFPYRGTNGNLYYPDDGESRTFHVTGWELQAAIETETVDEIQFLEWHDFEEKKSFKKYVHHFWDKRKEYKEVGDKGRDYYAKIFLTALYGKFAADPRKYKQYKLRPADALDEVIKQLKDNSSFHRFREWLIVGESSDGKKNRFYNLATAASITGYVRAKLWRAICEAKESFYCDTDSVTAKDFGSEVLLGKELGQWEIENEYDRIVIAGKKLYAFHKIGNHKKAVDKLLRDDPNILTRDHAESKVAWKIASKGARIIHTEIIKAANGEPVTFRSMAPTFSASKAKPEFISRVISKTASDIRFVPRRYDPKYVE